MSYEPKYKRWVEKQTSKDTTSNEVIEVYRGVPIIQEKIKDNPVEYRLKSPKARARNIKKLREKIDKQLDTVSEPRVSSKDYEGLYRQKFEESQKELVDLQRRDNLTQSKVKGFQVKVDELSGEVLRLKEEAVDLRRQLDESKATISEYNKKK